MLTEKLLPTGIGSLPYQNVEQALEKINRYFPQVPYWPQLPQRNKKEFMLESFLFPWVQEGLVNFTYGRGIFTIDKNKLNLYKKVLEKNQLLPYDIAPGLYKLTEFISKGYFAKAQAVKGQLTGPNTLCKYNFLASSLPLNHNEKIVEAVLLLLEKQLDWQVGILQKTDLPVIVFIDEPAGFPEFYEPYAEELEQGLKQIILRGKNQGVIMGIHVCSKPDWYKLTRLPVDIISFDAFSNDIVGKDVEYVQHFFHKGGKIAWGVVPTICSTWKVVEERLQKHKNLILKGGLVTPSCGLGIASADVTEQVMKFTQNAAEYEFNK